MIRKILKKKLSKSLLVSLIISLIITLILVNGLLNTWDTKISDAFYNPSYTLDDIVIVTIDDKSLQEIGRWPWSRATFAQVIDKLNESAVIGIDVSFFEAAEGDSELAISIKENNVVLAMEYSSFTYIDGELYGETVLKPSSTLGTEGVDYQIGYVNLYTDYDGVTRTFSPHITGVENNHHFAMVVVGEYVGIMPVIKEDRLLINFYDEPGGYEYISFSDVYFNNTDPAYFKDKIVLIGATAPNLHDDAIVPISDKEMPGVEINANLVQQILTRDFIYYQSDFSVIGLIFLFAFIAGLLLYRFKIYFATILLIIIAIVYFYLSIVYFQNSGIIINILYPLLGIALVYVPLVVIFYLSEERSRKWITSLFGKYVSPVVINNLIKNPEKINLGGEKRDITIFFSDIRGFTSISEKLDPEELVHLLNEYLSEMSSIIIESQGLVDKYMGDAIMAFWGAPLEQSNHPEIACSSCLEMMKKLKDLQKKWEKENIPLLDIGIGVNSGEAIVGNMGSFKRFDYTAIGDNINLASRLEGLNKIYGTNIIISEYTNKKVIDKFETRKLDAVRVKGKKKPIFIFELLSQKNKLDNNQRKFVELFEAGLENYFDRKWKKAIEFFKDALKIKKDFSCNVFIKRCNDFSKNPPPKDWDGVWEMKVK